jgi:protein-disulfide isomerase
MASRKEQKEQARARRLAEEKAAAERARRNRRMQILGGTVLVAVALIVVAIAVSSSSSSSGSAGLQSGAKLNSLQKSVKNLLAGIPQSGNILGNPNAPVTMDYYGDLQCPICRDFTVDGGFPELVQKDVRSGKVKVRYLAFETATRDPTVFKDQHVAALSAGKQNQFWEYVELFYHQQGQEGTDYVTESFLRGLANQTHDISGLNVNTWRTDRDNTALGAQVTAQGAQGNATGVQGTPTLIAIGPKGKQPVPTGVPSYSDLENAINSVS